MRVRVCSCAWECECGCGCEKRVRWTACYTPCCSQLTRTHPMMVQTPLRTLKAVASFIKQFAGGYAESASAAGNSGGGGGGSGGGGSDKERTLPHPMSVLVGLCVSSGQEGCTLVQRADTAIVRRVMS